MNDNIILVNEADEKIGLMPKLEAHQKGLLHRAISVFIFNSEGEMLLQQRQHHKYHSGGLWTNTCCSHPFPNEKTHDAANRRLFEEMGLTAPLDFLFSFKYHAALDHELIEHELDHVFIGITDDLPKPNADEVMDYKYMNTASLLHDVAHNPNHYTEWFKICLENVLSKMK
tara:strand:- start:511 stop:1023 length:513 start_codon:yes stop_codon:yes gene_type:complete